MLRRRRWAAVAALMSGAVLMTACNDVTTSLACKVDVASPELIADREAAGIADCDPQAWSTTTDGKPADLPDITLACLGSTATASLAQVRGPAVINFWSSNCGPCREEMPALQEFSAQYGDQVTVLGLNFLDTYPGAAIDLAARTGARYPSLADACGDLQETDLHVSAGLPMFVFVAKDGSISQQLGGFDSVREIVTVTEKQLGMDLMPAKGANR